MMSVSSRTPFEGWGALTALISRVLQFGLVSGAGLALDFVIFTLLVTIGVRAGYANCLSAFVAISFVYFTSIRHIFAYREQFLLLLFGIYLLYQIVAVALASWAIDVIVAHHVAPVLAKCLILPVTFSANYLFMSYLAKLNVSTRHVSG